MRRTSAETREHVLQITHDLFYWHGIRVTGVDRVAATAGVAPTTLYRLFTSKDELVTAYLERAFLLYRRWFVSAVGDSADPAARIRALFAALAEQTEPGQCRGCPFLMALAEHPDQTHPAHQQAIAMKRWVRGQLGELTAPLPVPDPAGLADQLALIMEGVYATAQARVVGAAAEQAGALVDILLAGADTGKDIGKSAQ
jgi:AcrR family transcriptional regulator